MKTIFRFFALALIVMGFSQCSQDGADPMGNLQINSSQLTMPGDQLTAQLGTGLLYATQYPEVRVLLKKTIEQTFDGDYNIMLVQIQNELITIDRNRRTDRITFGELIVEGIEKASPDGVGSGSVDAQGFIQRINAEKPLIQFSLPLLENQHPTDWNAESDQLPVVVVPEVIQNNKVPVFNPDGTDQLLSTEEEPEALVLIIRQNERVVAVPKNQALFETPGGVGLDCDGFMETGSHDYHMGDTYHDCTNPGSGTGGGTGGTEPTGCDRDNDSRKDQLYQAKFTSISNYRWARDGWLNGQIEMQVMITYVQNGSPQTITKLFRHNENDYRYCNIFDCDPRWKDFLSEIFTWDKNAHGDNMKYTWMEYDGTGGSVSSTITIPITTGTTTTTLSTTVTTNVDDLPLGEALVEYCDNTEGVGTTYNTGILEFRVRQQ